MNTHSRSIVIRISFIVLILASILNGYSASWDSNFSSSYPGSQGLTTAIALTAGDNRDEVFVAEQTSDNPITTVIHRWHPKKGWDYDGTPILVVNGMVYAMTYYAGKLYVGGRFDQIAESGSTFIPANSVAVYPVFAVGTLQALGSGVTRNGGIGGVYTIAVDNATGGSPWVYVGGWFNSPSANVARWNGSQWLDLNGGVAAGYWQSQPVNSIVLGKTGNYHDVYVGGSLIRSPTAGSGDGYNIAKWSQSDGDWRAFGHGIAGVGWDINCNPLFAPSDLLVTGMTLHTNGGTKTIRIIGDFTSAGYDFFQCPDPNDCPGIPGMGAATLDHVSSSLVRWAFPKPSIGTANYGGFPYFPGKVTSHSTGLYIAGAQPTSIWPFDCDPAAPPLTGLNILLWQDNNGTWHNVGGGFLSTDACVDLKSSGRGIFLAGSFGVKRYQP